jgi:ankyrin repeat protein
MSLNLIAAQIKKANAELVTKNDLTQEEKLELKRKRRVELYRKKREREEEEAAILLQSIFRVRQAKWRAKALQEKYNFIAANAEHFKKSKKRVAYLLRSTGKHDLDDRLKQNHVLFEKTVELLNIEKHKDYLNDQAKKENTLHDDLWPLIKKCQTKGEIAAEDRRMASLYLRRNGNDIINRPIVAKVGDGRTLLHRATYKGYFVCVQFLLTLGARVDCKDTNGRQPIHIASYFGDKAIVEILLKHGASANAVDYEKTTPLHLACYENCSSETIALLVEVGGSKLMGKDEYGVMPLHASCYRGHLDVVKYLVKKLLKDGRLKLAGSGGTSTYGNLLLSNKKMNKNGNGVVREWIAGRTNRGVTPLMCAAFYRHRDIMTFLSSLMNRDELRLKDQNGNTASKFFQQGASRENLDIGEHRWQIEDPLGRSEERM